MSADSVWDEVERTYYQSTPDSTKADDRIKITIDLPRNEEWKLVRFLESQAKEELKQSCAINLRIHNPPVIITPVGQI